MRNSVEKGKLKAALSQNYCVFLRHKKSNPATHR